MKSKKQDGAQMIVSERKRQVEAEGWTAEHDDSHIFGELALAAVCYAAPQKVFIQENRANAVQFIDPWPWDSHWDKRFDYGERRECAGNTVPDPETYSVSERVDLLVKAGALIAAEIDRLRRSKTETPSL